MKRLHRRAPRAEQPAPVLREDQVADTDVLAWMAAGLPAQPDRATASNPKGQFTVERCLAALARAARPGV